MTLTFNQDKYGSLLAQYKPKAISTEVENEVVMVGIAHPTG